ncbi:ATP-grasp domain-containing protein [Paraburkholderia sacchari]|uniref:RimK family alpha-L-glutamate ligase n=1 Tax=Paraburkholderia sacchari TaxID=159450 RepID=A0A8T6ZC82_9BURK|nr:RimK family alpha-L-glutamate ligase [Paraburkholderia sacchari]NLP62767.1 RimK family alpha-L-glutamate ligase [Paraburkholderia sacchari]
MSANAIASANTSASPSGPRVAIMTDETGWHTSRLKRALRERGAQGRCVDLADCRIDTTWAAHGLVIPGYGRGLPDAVIVRGIAGGTFEQVTVRLGILHALRELGVPVYNDARAIERSVDKSMTSFLLHRAGIPTPPAWAGESVPHARRIVMREAAAGREVVLKPLFGSQGKGLVRLGGGESGCAALPALRAYGGLAYMQRFVAPVSTPGFDWRVLVVGGKAVTAMRRVSEHWVHNVAQGGRCETQPLTPELAQLAERASAALGLDYAGIDLVPCGATDGGAQVIEVNGVAAWRGLQSVTSFDIAGCIVDDLLTRRLGYVYTPREAVA